MKQRRHSSNITLLAYSMVDFIAIDSSTVTMISVNIYTMTHVTSNNHFTCIVAITFTFILSRVTC